MKNKNELRRKKDGQIDSQMKDTTNKEPCLYHESITTKITKQGKLFLTSIYSILIFSISLILTIFLLFFPSNIIESHTSKPVLGNCQLVLQLGQ